mgnify:CR=1 FL=1
MGGFFEQGFELGEHHFDGVEVWRVGREIADGGADPFDGFAHGGVLMATEIVGNDDISCVQGGTEALAHVDQERFFVHGAIEHHRRGHGPHAQPGDEGGGVPVSARYAGLAALAFRRTTMQTRHVRRRARFVDKHELRDIKRGLMVFPFRPLFGDVRAFLLAGVQGFF